MIDPSHYAALLYFFVGLIFGLVELHHADQEYLRKLRSGEQYDHNSSADILFALFLIVAWPAKLFLLVRNWLRSTNK